jgi:hypothetical protein
VTDNGRERMGGGVRGKEGRGDIRAHVCSMKKKTDLVPTKENSPTEPPTQPPRGGTSSSSRREHPTQRTVLRGGGEALDVKKKGEGEKKTGGGRRGKKTQRNKAAEREREGDFFLLGLQQIGKCPHSADPSQRAPSFLVV